MSKSNRKIKYTLTRDLHKFRQLIKQGSKPVYDDPLEAGFASAESVYAELFNTYSIDTHLVILGSEVNVHSSFVAGAYLGLFPHFSLRWQNGKNKAMTQDLSSLAKAVSEYHENPHGINLTDSENGKKILGWINRFRWLRAGELDDGVALWCSLILNNEQKPTDQVLP